MANVKKCSKTRARVTRFVNADRKNPILLPPGLRDWGGEKMI